MKNWLEKFPEMALRWILPAFCTFAAVVAYIGLGDWERPLFFWFSMWGARDIGLRFLEFVDLHLTPGPVDRSITSDSQAAGTVGLSEGSEQPRVAPEANRPMNMAAPEPERVSLEAYLEARDLLETWLSLSGVEGFSMETNVAKRLWRRTSLFLGKTK